MPHVITALSGDLFVSTRLSRSLTEAAESLLLFPSSSGATLKAHMSATLWALWPQAPHCKVILSLLSSVSVVHNSVSARRFDHKSTCNSFSTSTFLS